MKDKQEIQRLVQSHKALEPFDYKIAVDWAIELIREGKETDNVLMLASFSEPIERHEISPYISAVLNDFGLEELEFDDALIAQTHFLLTKILRNEAIRENLQSLSQVCINNDYDKRIMDFYLLYHGWWELEDIGANYYYDGADLNNIESILKLEAKIWIDKYIHGKENLGLQQELKRERNKTLPTTLYKSNGRESAKTNDSNNNKSRSWWKRLWS
ncbi:hypothetical protein ACJD0Z_10675 [Flavobacteriaceae bacterium M23B6Z8]